jgi:hypothetical protein
VYLDEDKGDKISSILIMPFTKDKMMSILFLVTILLLSLALSSYQMVLEHIPQQSPSIVDELLAKPQ